MKLVHSVFFKLHDNASGKQESLVSAGHQFLKPHDGIVAFEMGPRNVDMKRDVNDQDFDVALVVVFDSQVSHDAYQVSPIHDQFIAEQKTNWSEVRVFDMSS